MKCEEVAHILQVVSFGNGSLMTETLLMPSFEDSHVVMYNSFFLMAREGVMSDRYRMLDFVQLKGQLAADIRDQQQYE